MADEDSPQALKKQILELQKAQSADSAKIEDLSNKILVLKNQMGGSVPTSPTSSPPPSVPAPPELATAPQPLAPQPPATTQVNPLVAVAAPLKVEKDKSSLTGLEKLYRQVVVD